MRPRILRGLFFNVQKSFRGFGKFWVFIYIRGFLNGQYSAKSIRTIA